MSKYSGKKMLKFPRAHSTVFKHQLKTPKYSVYSDVRQRKALNPHTGTIKCFAKNYYD